MFETVLAARDLRYDWPDAACLDLSELTLAPGETVFLAGPSGSGKSTLLNLLAGVLTPASGTLELLGAPWPAHGALRDRRRVDHVGIVFQQFNLVPYLSALENALLPCRFSRRRRQRAGDIAQAAQTLFARLDLAPALWSRRAAQLSVGQQQRVAAARALIGAPELILADEPTSALDAHRQSAFVELVLAAAREQNSAVLFVSHDTRLAARFDRTLALDTLNRVAP